MRRVALALCAAALLFEPACFVRPWAIEESERIDRMMECEVDDAEDEAFEGIAAPRGLSPVASVEPERSARSGPEGRQAKRKKGGRGTKAQVAFSDLTPTRKEKKR